MRKPPAKTRRPVRSERLEAKVDPRLYAAVEAFAIAKGHTLSSAVYAILLDWQKLERHRAARRG